MSPVITFGGLLGEATEGRIVGVVHNDNVVMTYNNITRVVCAMLNIEHILLLCLECNRVSIWSLNDRDSLFLVRGTTSYYSGEYGTSAGV